MDNQEKTLKVGTVLHGSGHDYRINRVLGQGTFGITYLAYTQVTVTGELGTLQTDIQVAVKEFFMGDINGREGSTVTTGGSSGMFEYYRKKFAREARNLANLKHPDIVKVLETFDANGTSYFAMEYCGGGSLDTYIAHSGGIPQSRALELFGQIASALSHMHERRMLHLDMKPGNIMLRNDGTTALIDFGLSKQFNPNGEPESSTTIGNGTPGYAPLEQADYNEEESTRYNRFPVTMDIYALGATLYKMLTGERPPKASEVLAYGFPEQTLRAHGVGDSVVAAVRRSMQPKPVDRYQSVEAFAEALNVNENSPADNEETEINAIVIDPVGNYRPQPIPPIYIQPTIEEHVARQHAGLPMIEMVHVQGGTFDMGAWGQSQDAEAGLDELPVHSVTLDSYHIGKYEVTQLLWVAVMGSNPSYFKGDYLPVENVSWNDVQEFLQKLNILSGKNYRPPTEAEWEYAARGGNRSVGCKYSGGNKIGIVAWYGSNSGGRTHQVGALPPNELGICDMSGNVWEWCHDWYGRYNNVPQKNPRGAVNGLYRVYRGGGWYFGAKHCRVSNRNCGVPSNHYNTLGFRLAL